MKAEPTQTWIFPMRGRSMEIFLKSGDLLRVRRESVEALRVGDVVVFLAAHDRKPEYVAHRLLGVMTIEASKFALTKGDSNWLFDALVPLSSVVGRLDAVRVQGRWRSVDRGSWTALAMCAAGPALRSALDAVRRCGAPRLSARAALALQSAAVRRCARREIAAPDASSPTAIAGIVDVDQTWSGAVEACGDVFVSPGVTLTLSPGTTVRFLKNSQWTYGASPSAPSRVIVAGRLACVADEAAPIRFLGENWGGIRFIQNSRGNFLENVEIDGVDGAALRASEGAAVALRSSQVSNSRCGVSVGGGGRVDLDDCNISFCSERGLSIEGGTLNAANCVVKDAGDLAVFLSGGAATLDTCVLRGGRVGLQGLGGTSHLRNTRLTKMSAQGADLSGGAHRFENIAFRDCAEDWRGSEDARIDWIPGRPQAPLKEAVVRFVQATRGPGSLGTVYRRLYAATAWALRWRLRQDENIQGLELNSAVPGHGMNLSVVARDLSGEFGSLWQSEFWRKYLTLKRVIPYLGECLVAEPSDFAAGGRGENKLEVLTRAAHAYTSLSSELFRASAVSNMSAGEARRAALEMAEALQSDALARRARGDLRSPSGRAAVCAQALEDFDRRARVEIPFIALSASADVERFTAPLTGGPSDHEREVPSALRAAWTTAIGPALASACVDNFYRSFIILRDDKAGEDVFAAAFGGLARLYGGEAEPPTTPILLTQSAWRVWCVLPYLEAPGHFANFSTTETGEVVLSAGSLFPGVRQRSWGGNLLGAAAFPRELVLAQASESWRKLRRRWRFQVSPASPNSPEYKMHYVLSRVLGLRLFIERGVSAPFFDVDRLKDLYAREFPEEAAELAQLWQDLLSREGPPGLDLLCRWVDRTIRAARISC